MNAKKLPWEGTNKKYPVASKPNPFGGGGAEALGEGYKLIRVKKKKRNRDQHKRDILTVVGLKS